MHPVNFEGAVSIAKPDDMTDEQCTSAWAKYGFDILFKIFNSNGIAKLPSGIYAGIDSQQFSFFMTSWQPNKEDIEAINRGEPIFVKTLSTQLPPMSLFTVDESGQPNC